MSGFNPEYSLYPDPEECSRNFSVAPRGPEYEGTYLDPAVVAAVLLPPGPAAAAAAATTTTTANDDEDEEDTAAAPAPAGPTTTTTITDQTPGGLANRVFNRDREAAAGATAADSARTTRWVCYVRGCAVSATTTNKREIGRHWHRGAHPGEPKAHDPKKVFGVDYGEWLADEGLRATWEATTEEEFEALRGEQGGEEEEKEEGDDDEKMQD